MPTLVEWPTANANAYQSVADVEAYLDNALHAAPWRALLADDQTRAAITATRMLDTARWQGTVTVTGQPLAWPRSGAVLADGTALSDATIPAKILQAHAELCNALAIDPEGTQAGQRRVKSLSEGSSGVSVTWSEGTAQQGVGGFPPIVARIIAELLAGAPGAVAGTAASTAYGTEDENGDPIVSEFEDRDRWGVVR